MEKKTKIGLYILGAAAAYAVYRFYSMPKEDREEMIDTLKEKTRDLLDNAEHTVEKVEHYVEEIKSRGKDAWLDKFYVLKKMFTDLYGGESKLISRVN